MLKEYTEDTHKHTQQTQQTVIAFVYQRKATHSQARVHSWLRGYQMSYRIIHMASGLIVQLVSELLMNSKISFEFTLVGLKHQKS